MPRWSRPVLFAVAMALMGSVPVNASSVSYQYDALGRLISVNYGSGKVVTYTYDAAGNRISTVVTSPANVWGSFTWGAVTW